MLEHTSSLQAAEHKQSVYDRTKDCNFKNGLFYFFNKVLVFFSPLFSLFYLPIKKKTNKTQPNRKACQQAWAAAST